MLAQRSHCLYVRISRWYLVLCLLCANFLWKQVTIGGFLKATDALSGELWEAKKERIRRASIHGKTPGWDLRSVSKCPPEVGFLLK